VHFIAYYLCKIQVTLPGCEHRRFAASRNRSQVYALKSEAIAKLIVIAACRPASASFRVLAFVSRNDKPVAGLRLLITAVICGWRDEKRARGEDAFCRDPQTSAPRDRPIEI